MNKILITLLVAGLLPVLAQADLYKWKDKQGRTHYSDIPPPDVKADNLKAKPAVSNAPVVAKETGKDEKNGKEVVKGNEKDSEKDGEKSLEEAAAKRQKEAEEKKKADAEKAEIAKQKVADCRIARQNLASLNNGGRIYRTLDNGERDYMTDKDITSSRQSAQQAVNKFCS